MLNETKSNQSKAKQSVFQKISNIAYRTSNVTEFSFSEIENSYFQKINLKSILLLCSNRLKLFKWKEEWKETKSRECS